MNDPATHSIVLTHISSSLLSVGAIQIVKKHPWIQQAKKVLCRLLSAALATATYVGIQWTWNPTDHSLLITGLSISAITIGLFHIAAQFIYNETGYQVLSGLQTLPQILKALQTLQQPKA